MNQKYLRTVNGIISNGNLQKLNNFKLRNLDKKCVIQNLRNKTFEISN